MNQLPMATMITPRPTKARGRSCNHLRTFVVASLALIVVSLFASFPAASARPDKRCIEVKEDYDLRNAARDANVFLIVHESDNKDAKEHICKKLEATPDQRLTDAADKGKGVVFAYLEIKDGHEDYEGEWHDGNRNFVKTSLGLKTFPSFLYLSKGMDGFSKYASHLSHYKGSADTLDLSDVEKFIEKKVGYRLGNDVYNIIFFDTLASRFVSYGDATGMDRYKQRLLQLLVRFSTLFSFKEPFSSIGKLYNRAFAMSFEHGVEYCEKQVKKLEKKMESNRSSISEDKVHEIQQKIAILKSFAAPKELTPDDDKQIFIHGMLHLGLILATILLFIVPADESEGGGDSKKDQEEVINAEPVIAKPVEGDNDESSKKTK